MKVNRFVLVAVMGLLGSVWTSHAAGGITVRADDDQIIVGLQYTATSFHEFLWGLSRPLHLWNTRADGRKEILPFWTRPLKPGGALCWVNPTRWGRNPCLTAGTLTSEALAAGAAIAVTAGNRKHHSGGSSPAASVPAATTHDSGSVSSGGGR